MMRSNGSGGATSLWEQTRSQRWALLIGLVVGVVIGASVAILFRPLVIAIVLVLLALLVYRVVRAVRGRGGAEGDPAPGGMRGMVITGSFAEPPVRRADPAAAPVWDLGQDAPAPAPVAREPRRGPEYDAEIDAILANIDRQITGEGAAPRRRATPPTDTPRSDPSRVQDADWNERS
jgi:hypothetical protein